MERVYKVLKPSYYDEFKCVGSKCENTCCKGWNITIDELSYKRYKSVGGKYGERLKNSIILNNRKNKSTTWYAEFKLNEDGRCMLLTEDGLCSVYSELGEENMCLTCKIYPRLIKKYNDFCEKNLIMSCPEAARFLCEHTEPLDFVFREEQLNDLELLIKNNYIDKKLYDLFFEVRGFYIDVAQYRTISLWKRLYFILRAQNEIATPLKQGRRKPIEGIIQCIKKEMNSEEIINELNKIEPILEVKIRVLSLYLSNDKSETELQECCEIFKDFIKGNEMQTVVKQWKDIEKEYDEKYHIYDYIYENYIVYYIYEYYFKSDNNNIIRELTISYMLLKAMNLLKYIKYGEIDINKIKENIYILSRIVDNSKAYLDATIKKLDEIGLWTMEYLLILIR